MEKLEGILGNKLSVVHMVGGGAKNELLCRFTAGATGRPVLAGPVEATAAGNLLVQAIALGQLKNLQEARQIVRCSFALKTYEPDKTGMWEEGFGRFLKLLGS
jgi:rhamnulokinase